MLLLLNDGTHLPVTELPGSGPWTFLVLQPTPGPGGVARLLTRFGRAVVPDLRGRPGWSDPPGEPGLLDLVDDLDQIRTRAGLGRPILVGLEALVPLALRAVADQPWAWRALILAAPPAGLAAASAIGRLDLPVLVLGPEPGSAPELAAVERLLDGLGGGPGWAGIAPHAPPR